MNILIKESEWKTEREIELKKGNVYWIKLANGNIVMGTIFTTRHSSGIAEVSFSEDRGLLVNPNCFYMCKDAKFQEVK